MKNIFSNVVLLLLSFTTFSQLTNNGATIYIETGTTVYVENDVDNQSGSMFINEGDLHLNGNLNNDGTMKAVKGVYPNPNPNASTGITYFNNPTTLVQTITGTDPVVFGNLVVDKAMASSAKGVTVADGMEVVVERAVTLTNGDLRLLGTSQLIQKHTLGNQNPVTTGKLLIDQQGTAVSHDYNYWSSPVGGATINTYAVSEVLFDGSDSANNPFTPTTVDYISGNGYNGNVSTLSGGNVTNALDIHRYWLWKFEDGDIDDYDDWFQILENGALNAGVGFTMKGVNSAVTSGFQNYVFKGKPNDGNYTFTLGANKSSLLGNPYPSALDANKFIFDNSTVLANSATASATTGALYFWEHWGGGSHFLNAYQGGYATLSLAGGVAPTCHSQVSGSCANGGSNGFQPSTTFKIPVGQGFFVESITGTGSTPIVFNNSMRVFELEGVDSNFYKTNNNITTTTSTDLIPRIRLGYNNPNGFYRQIMTAFIPECNDDHNTAYDARMVDVNPEDMYWVTNAIEYIIDARPFTIDAQIPIGISVAQTGIQTIFIDELENFTNDIYILDTDTGFTHDLNLSNFEVNLTAGVYNDRFKLVFQPSSIVNVNEALIASAIQVYYTDNSSEIIIKNKDKLILKSARIYNTIGQLIKVISKQDLLLNQIHVPFNVAKGSYLVHIETSIGKKTYKLIAY
ncbi:MAG: T9SS type A sorting domain-containing protein [Flavobacteriaceae bacterium]